MRVVLRVAVALGIGAIAWLYRFNDPLGSYAGLTDDHFFYVIRGWQLLFGELPTRDFVDPGAPLTFLVAAAAQWFGRGTLSEMVVCVTALALGAALTFVLAAKVARSMLVGVGAAALQVALMTRLYSYPKILVYAIAIPLLWAFATKPSGWRRFALALVTAVAFLFRYDHGVFVALSVAVLLFLLADVPWGTRVRHAVIYGGIVAVLLTPYLAYLQMNGGIVFQFQTANSWSARDRARAPLVWPRFTRDVGTADGGQWPALTYLAHWAGRNSEAWMFYMWVLLPLVCLAVLSRAPRAFRPDWPRARVKIAVVAVLATMLNVGLLRGNLSARFGDVSVPQAILAAWLIMACVTIGRRGQWDGHARVGTVTRILVPALAIVGVMSVVIMLVLNHHDRDVLLSVNEARAVIQRFKFTWPLERWASPSPTGSVRVARYLQACTRPGDHLFVTPYLPQVIGLADRPFAGGHGDLRPDFFNTDVQQRLTIERLRRQEVPIVIMPPQDEYAVFQQSFPILDVYLRTRFRPAGTLDLGDGNTLQLFVDRARPETSRYQPFDWPCFG